MPGPAPAYNRAMTPNFVAALAAIASFATACCYGAPNPYAIWVYTFLMASAYGVVASAIFLIFLNEDKGNALSVLNLATIVFAIGFAIPYRRGMLPGDWAVLELLFWALPAINWGLNLWLTYKLIEGVQLKWLDQDNLPNVPNQRVAARASAMAPTSEKFLAP